MVKFIKKHALIYFGEVMADCETYVLTWLEEFLKNKDLIQKRIAHMERIDAGLRVERKDGSVVVYIPAPALDEDVLAKARSRVHVGIITFNTPANVAFLKKRWEAFVALGRHAQIIFINPASARETRWIIFPATQAMLSEENMHAASIDTIREGVDELADIDIQKLVNEHG